MSIREDRKEKIVQSSFCLGGHVSCLVDQLWVNPASGLFLRASHIHPVS